VDIYVCEPVSPFPVAASAAFNTFTTKQNVTTLGNVPVVPVDKMRAGSKIEVSAQGNFSTTATPTLSLGFWIGTRALAMTIDLAISSAITTGTATLWPWTMEWKGFCTTAGASGALLGQGKLFLGTALTTFATPVPIPITAALRTVAIDTTIPRAFGVSAAYSASNVLNAVVVDDLRVTILN